MSSDDRFLSSYFEEIDPDVEREESVKNAADIWGFDFIEEYVHLGNQHSFENDHLHVGLCLAELSQAVGDSTFFVNQGKQSTRVHPLIIQGSGTGKNPAFTLAMMVAQAAEIKWTSVSDLTNAGLIGTISDNEEQPGVAKTADIIGFREATSLFRSAEQLHSQTLGENLNKIMDGETIQREMAGGTLSFTPTCTLVGTTYPPSDLDLDRLMENGTLARFFYLFKPTDDEYRFRMGRRIEEESIGEPDPETGAKKIVDLGQTLEVISDQFEDGKEFAIAPSVAYVDVTGTIRDTLEEFNKPTQSIVQPAITRYVVHHRRLSCLMAALDYCSTTVTKKHADQALTLVEESWRNMLQFYEHHYSESSEDDETPADKSQLEILKALGRENGRSQTELAEATGLSKRTIRKHVNALELEGCLTVEKDGREKRYHVGG